MFEGLARTLKVVGAVVLVGLGAVGGVSYGASDRDEFKHEVVIKAKPDKVWELLEDPTKIPRWMPQDLLDIARVEVVERREKGETTHRLVLRDGRVIELNVSKESDDKLTRASVMSPRTGYDAWYSSLEWGFETEKIDGTRTESNLKFNMRYTLTRPFGTLRQFVRRITGKAEADAKRIFDGIERAAREI